MVTGIWFDFLCVQPLNRLKVLTFVVNINNLGFKCLLFFKMMLMIKEEDSF